MKTTWTKGPDQGMNGLKLSTSQKPAKSNVNMVTNLGNLGAKVKPLVASTNPGQFNDPSKKWPAPKPKP